MPLVYREDPNFCYFPLLPLAKFNEALMWKIPNPPASQIWEKKSLFCTLLFFSHKLTKILSENKTMAQDTLKHTFGLFFRGQMHLDVPNQLPSFNYKHTKFTCNSITCIGIWVGHDNFVFTPSIHYSL